MLSKDGHKRILLFSTSHSFSHIVLLLLEYCTGLFNAFTKQVVRDYNTSRRSFSAQVSTLAPVPQRTDFKTALPIYKPLHLQL